MATVLLLRHGRSTTNADGTLAGHAPVGLDETGILQAKEVGERLAGLALAAVLSSPLLRCTSTLELALPEVTPIVDDRLIECGYGDWQGQRLDRLAKDPLWSVVQQYPSAVTFPGGESMAAMAARAVAAVRDWDTRITAAHGPDALWLACSHGDVIKAVVADALGLHLDLFQRIAVDPGSLTVLRYTPLRAFVLRLNDTGTLAALVPPKRRRGRRGAGADSDASVGGAAGVGGGAGGAGTPGRGAGRRGGRGSGRAAGSVGGGPREA